MVYGNTISQFMEYLSTQNAVFYFHNLAFDGYFIIDWLLNNGFKWRESYPKLGEFSTLISKSKKFYSMKIKFPNGSSVEIRDSLKKLSMSVNAIADAFQLPLSKLHIDYDEYRAEDHSPTTDELKYLFNDLAIVGMALHQQLSSGMKKLTVGADSLNEFKDLFGRKTFERVFPVLSLDIDKDIRGGYRGGWTYRDERFAQTMVGPGATYDVNSLYPSVMYNCPLPWGYPEWFPDIPEQTDEFPLFIMSITFTAKLKPNHVPTIQLKSHPIFVSTEYVREINEPETMIVTNVDLELWEQQYDIEILSYNGGWKFRAHTGFFKDYIDKWSEIKNNSKGGMRLIAKLHLNSLYGKFATNPDITGKVPYLEDGVVCLKDDLENTRNPVYTAMGVFITAYGRSITIRAAQANYDVFAYADTDSIHLLTLDKPKGIVVDDSLGNWKHEYDFDYAMFWRAKVYMERIMPPLLPLTDKRAGRYETHVAGMPANVQDQLRFTDFESGKVFGGKLLPKHVPGGIVLLDGNFTLK